MSRFTFDDPTQLPTIPGVALQLLQRLSSPDHNAREIAELISTDPAMTARLLSVANSSLYSLPCTITDPGQAVTLLGTPTITAMVLGFSLSPSNNFRSKHGEHYRQYWMGSVVVATSSMLLARRTMPYEEALLFTTGLLADIGQLAMLQADEENYVLVRQAASDLSSPLCDAEAHAFDETHAEVAGRLMAAWKLPKVFQEIAESHHLGYAAIDEGDIEHREAAQATAFSARLADFIASPSDAALEELNGSAKVLYDWEPATVREHIDGVLRQTSEMAEIFSLDADQLAEQQSVIAAAMVQLTESTAQQAADKRAVEEQTVELKRENTALAAQVEALTIRAARDDLTGLYNREYLVACLDQHLADPETQSEGLGLIFIDVDNFKNINDTHGHIVGDMVLKQVARMVRDSVRGNDLVARYAGDEFVIATSPSNSLGMTRLAERLRERISQEAFSADSSSFRLTLSIGGILTTPSQCSRTAETLIEEADKAMYESKKNGRNTIHITRLNSVPAPKTRKQPGQLSRAFGGSR